MTIGTRARRRVFMWTRTWPRHDRDIHSESVVPHLGQVCSVSPSHDQGPLHAWPGEEVQYYAGGKEVYNHGCEGAVSRRCAAHQVKLELWSELLRNGDGSLDLTGGARFDWQGYIHSFSEEAQQIICCGDVSRITRFCGEVHATDPSPGIPLRGI